MNHPLTYTREFVQVGTELPFVLFHLSVAVCIARQVVQRNNTFRTVFFKLYLAQTVSDVGSYLTVGWLSSFASLSLLTRFAVPTSLPRNRPTSGLPPPKSVVRRADLRHSVL